MPETVTLTKAVDVYVTATRPALFGDTRLYVHSAANAYVYFPMPTLPAGAVLTSAKLKANPRSGIGTNATVNLHKVTQAFDWSGVTWDAQPTVGSQVATITKAFSSSVWEFDVLTHLQAVLNGEAWFGWRMSSPTVNIDQYFFGSQSTDLPLSLELVFTVPPKTPTDLYPTGNAQVNVTRPTLMWRVTDGAVGSVLTHFQVQVDDVSDFATPVYDSGSVASGLTQLDLSTTAFTALTNGQSRYWRVRVRNDSGIWSDWSAVAQWTYVSPMVLTITAPAATTADPTPDITWTFTGGTQLAKQVQLYAANVLGPPTLVWDSGVIYDNVLSYTIPVGMIQKTNHSYRVVVRVWPTTTTTVSITGQGTMYEKFQDFQWIPSGATNAVGIEIVDNAPLPHKILRWQYTGSTTNLTHFNIFRTINGVERLVKTISAAEADAAEPVAGWYRWTDLMVPGRRTVTYSVQVVWGVTGQSSVRANDPTATIKINNPLSWVISVAYNNKAFSLADADIDPGLSETSDVVEPQQGGPILVLTKVGGFVGSASGIITTEIDMPTHPAENQKEDFWWIRNNSRRCYLVWQDQAIECMIYNMAMRPFGLANGKTDYAVSFDFIQV